MDTFRDTAFYLTLWHAFLAALCAVLLIALNDLAPATGFLIAANMALLFALVLMARRRPAHRGASRAGHSGARCRRQSARVGEAGLRLARRALDETWLRFAKGAAAVAIVLSGLAFASNGVSASPWPRPCARRA